MSLDHRIYVEQGSLLEVLDYVMNMWRIEEMVIHLAIAPRSRLSKMVATARNRPSDRV
jgi:hypothetical protein